MTAPTATARPKAGFVSKALAAFGLLLLCAAVNLGAAPVARAEGDAKAFILSLTDNAVAIITDKSLDAEGRLDAFRKMFQQNADFDRIASFALGRYARPLRASNRYDEYASLFREYVVRIYAARMSGYNGQKVTVDKVQPRGDTEVIVYSTILPGADGGSAVPVNWRLAKSGDGFKILDVNIVGAWMSIEQQSQFTSIINRNGGDATSIIAHLQQQLAKGTPDDPAKRAQSPT